MVVHVSSDLQRFSEKGWTGYHHRPLSTRFDPLTISSLSIRIKQIRTLAIAAWSFGERFTVMDPGGAAATPPSALEADGPRLIWPIIFKNPSGSSSIIWIEMRERRDDQMEMMDVVFLLTLAIAGFWSFKLSLRTCSFWGSSRNIWLIASPLADGTAKWTREMHVTLYS